VSAAQGWAGPPAADPPVVTPTPAAVIDADKPTPFDLDQIQIVAWSVAGAVLYLLFVVVGVFAFAAAFGMWAGAVVGIAGGAVPSAYSLRQASQRRAVWERERAGAEFRGAGDAPGITLPSSDVRVIG